MCISLHFEEQSMRPTYDFFKLKYFNQLDYFKQ